MVIHDGQHFYVNELAQCRDGMFVIPVRWVERGGVLCGDVYKVVLHVCALSFFLVDFFY